MQILQDPHRTFISSLYLELELLPKAVYHQRKEEFAFYETFLASSQRVPDGLLLLISARQFAENYGLKALDALHIAAAYQFKAKQFITTEKPTKPMFRVTEFPVIYLGDIAPISS